MLCTGVTNKELTTEPPHVLYITLFGGVDILAVVVKNDGSVKKKQQQQMYRRNILKKVADVWKISLQRMLKKTKKNLLAHVGADVNVPLCEHDSESLPVIL